MFFLHASLLYLLVLPLILFLLSFMQTQGLESFFSKAVLEKLSINKAADNSKRKYRFFLLAIALFILSLAQPVTAKKSLPQTLSIPLVIAIDFSKSMQIQDIYPNRLAFAKEKAQLLLAHAKNLQVGILFFTKDSYLAYPISENLPAIAAMLQRADFNKTLGRGTNIFAAIEGANILLKNYSNKNILLLSDGGEKSNFKEERAYLKENNLSLYALDINSNKSKNLTYGSQDIDNILAQLQEDALRKATPSSKIKRNAELFQYPLFLGLLLLVYIFSSFKKENFILLFILFQFTPKQAHAGLLDFYEISKAQSCYKEKKYLQAIAIYKKLPQTKEARYNLAVALYKAKKYEQALKTFKRSLSNDKTLNAKILHNIGNCYFQQKRVSLAKKYYKKSYAISKNRYTKENLAITNKILKRLKKRNKKEIKGLPMLSKLTIEQKDFSTTVSSDFTVKLQDMVMSEEQKWMQLLKHRHAPLFLRKLNTKRRSINAQNDF
jgi:Ca-activated chloride channel family protein